ncbi:hypothetical protein [Stackebrandtia albiflava]|uniref:hypothetical protein n=1 Tax=Stackebrandtia albiflava TaxID=406432 RepID=UPI0011BF9B11|nr:hypothetical protein [Stackebrandtia albiflava]
MDAAGPVAPGDADTPAGDRIVVDHTGELLELALTDAALTAGHHAVADTVLGLYRRALTVAEGNAATASHPVGDRLPNRRAGLR